MKTAELTDILPNPADRSAFLSAYAGGSTRIPTKPKTLLANVPDLTPAAAEALVKVCSGAVEYIPAVSTEKNKARDHRIMAEYRAGTPTKAIALQFELSQKQIQNIIKKGTRNVSNIPQS
jgi:hypothetical protein